MGEQLCALQTLGLVAVADPAGFQLETVRLASCPSGRGLFVGTDRYGEVECGDGLFEIEAQAAAGQAVPLDVLSEDPAAHFQPQDDVIVLRYRRKGLHRGSHLSR